MNKVYITKHNWYFTINNKGNFMALEGERSRKKS
jgi:hypothetical protein